MKFTKINNVSNEAVGKATGKSWDEWIKTIDKAGGKNMDHKQIVAFLNKEFDISSWWQQSVTVGYEYARGKRVVGETVDAGFQVGVQKTVKLSQKIIWDQLVSQSGINIWLGDTAVSLKKGETYRTKQGIAGEIRVVKPIERIRLSWQPKDWKKSSTLQITLSCPRNNEDKTTVNFHHEKLPDTKTREKMKVHWRNILNDLFTV